MRYIQINKELVQHLRELEYEQVFTGIIKDSIIDTSKMRTSLSTDPVMVIDDNSDVIIHNHINESEFSSVDLKYMFPNFYYVLVTPTRILGMYNKENIECVSI